MKIEGRKLVDGVGVIPQRNPLLGSELLIYESRILTSHRSVI